MRLAIAVALSLFALSVEGADLYFVVKCASGTPAPKNYVVSFNGGSPTNVAPHVGADNGVYLVIASSAMPQGTGTVTASADNDFGANAPRTYTVNVGIPAPMGDFVWMPAKP